MVTEKRDKNKNTSNSSHDGENAAAVAKKSSSTKRGSIYKQQLVEKQKVKRFYGIREKQFRRFFDIAVKTKTGATGANFLCLLERRADNVLYRLRLAMTRKQARQMIVHGHVFLNGHKIKSPSMLLKTGDHISIADKSVQNVDFMQNTVEKRINVGVKVPEWLELRKDKMLGVVSKLPERSDVHVQTEESLIVEFYSK